MDDTTPRIWNRTTTATGSTPPPFPIRSTTTHVDVDVEVEEPAAPARSAEQHRWRRLIAIVIALMCLGWLVTTALSSFAFITVLKQNDNHVDELTGLLTEGRAQRGSVIGSAEEQADQRQAALATERAKTRATTAQAGESRASRDAAHADKEKSQSEGSRADAQTRSVQLSADLALDRQRSADLVATSVARDHDAQGALARAQAKLTRGQTRLTAAQKKLTEAQQRAADALAALARACRERRLPNCFSLPIGGPVAAGE